MADERPIQAEPEDIYYISFSVKMRGYRVDTGRGRWSSRA
jgi:hypothetical protein